MQASLRGLASITFLLVGACADDPPNFGANDEAAESNAPDASVDTGDTDSLPSGSASGSDPSGDGAAPNPSGTASSGSSNGGSSNGGSSNGSPLPPSSDTGNLEGSMTSPAECQPGDAECPPAAADCPDGCRIGDVCYSDGEVNADNTCQICDVLLSTSGWSNDDGKSCDDDRFCTVDDLCYAGECAGDDRVCDDGVACNGAETCDDATSQCLGATSICAAGEICDVANDTCSLDCAGCVIDGSCYAAESLSPTNPCLVCNPTVATDDWSIDVDASCDDGDLCTEDDVCDSAGQCAGTDVVCVDDAEVCGANRACDPGTGLCADEFPGTSVTCDDMDACTANDRCDGAGECQGTPTADPSVGCVCVTDADCNDGLSCTQDTCNGNTCSNTINAGSCVIDGTCRANGNADPNNVCRVCDVSQSQSAWTNAGSSTSCDDGVWCNGADTCNAGSCSHEFPGGNRCAGGSTCNNTCNEAQQNCFAPNTQACGNPEEYRCQSGCEGDAERRLGTQYCTGFSDECSGTIDWGTGWDTWENCDETQICTGNSASASCVQDHQCTCEASSETYYDDTSGFCWELDHSDQLHTGPSGETYCAGRDTGDITDWELPNIVDLITLLRGCRNGTEDDIDELSLCVMEVDGEPDPNCGVTETCNGTETCGYCDEGAGPASGCYWPAELEGICSRHYTSTAATSQSHWAVDFDYGNVGQGHDNTNSYFVRCVNKP